MQSRAFKILLPIALVVMALAVTVVLVKTRPHAQRQTPPAPRPRVTVMTVGETSDPVITRGFGSVKAKRSVTLVPQVSGEVVGKNPHFEPGGYFTAGEVLLKIDDTDYLLAVARARADLAQAEVNLARAQEEAQVARDEWESIGRPGLDPAGNRTAPSPLVLHEPQLKLAEASLEAARSALRQAEVNLGRCTIAAPFDGRVLDGNVDTGQYLRSGTAIGTIYATDVAEITVAVPDEELAWITLDPEGSRPADVTVTGEFAGANHTWLGRAVRLGGAVDARSRLVPVVVEVDRPYQSSDSRPPLVEGMFVEVRFSGAAPQGSVVIPRTALRPNNLVWVANPEGKLEIRQVQVARAGVHQALVTAGLTPGDRVCTSNLQYVTEGMSLLIEGQNPNTAPQAGQGGGER